jgi:amidohydrolase
MISKEIIALRQHLHQHPEISNHEFETATTISDFLNKYNPSQEIKFGATGRAFVFAGKNPGKIVIFRAELDALPIAEKSNLPYKSVNENVAHLCGHDGHMAILAGLAEKISQDPIESGNLVLLFQNAEEVEQGAKDVVEHDSFKKMKPDYIFALHNIPRVEKHKILLRNGSFSAASKGMTIKLFGKTSHAAEPENGISPAAAISKIIKSFHEILERKNEFSDLILLTIIHITMGEISFGTSPGYAEVRVTLRAFENQDMEVLTTTCEKIVAEVSKDEKLKFEITYNEVFPATENVKECVDMVATAAEQNKYDVAYIEKPFKWSEDFAYFSVDYKTCLFGLGSGVNHPSLHNPDYHFPDDIIETGANLFYTIYKNIQKK